jgi:predicted phosphodiesterase
LRVINYHWPRTVRYNEPAILYVFADTHFGNTGMNLPLLKKHIEQCRKEKAAWIHLGDWVEGITPKDPRFTIHGAHPVRDEYRLARYTFAPIADQGTCILSGNHDEYISKTYGDEVQDLAEYLDVPYMGYTGFLKFNVEAGGCHHPYTFFLHHGHGGGFLLGAKAINLQRLSSKFVADVYLVGHLHTYIQHIDNIIGIRHKGRHPKLVTARRYYAQAPSYFDPYVEDNGTNYAEMRALYPQPQGCLRIEINHWLEGRQHEWGLKIEPVME